MGPSKLLDYYLSRGSEPVRCDSNALSAQGYKVFFSSLKASKLQSRSVLRHDPRRLSLAVMRAYHKEKRNMVKRLHMFKYYYSFVLDED